MPALRLPRFRRPSAAALAAALLALTLPLAAPAAGVLDADGPAAAGATAAEAPDADADAPVRQPGTPREAPPAPGDDRLYRALGGQDGIARITEDFIAAVHSDPRTRPYFAQASVPRLRAKLAEFFCAWSGGPCVYTGSSMRRVHSNLHIDRAAFNAVVENLQEAMGKNGVPFASQNALLARLAPLHRQIETR